jgi:hypothetical protein
MQMPAKPAYQERYRIHAYIRQGSITKRFVDGRVTFAWVYQNRPAQHQFAVVSVWDTNTRNWLYEVIDLYKVKKRQDNQLVPPKPRLTHTDKDAALMAALLIYNADENGGV